MGRAVLLALGGLGLTSSAFGQSFNIDFGSAAGVPRADFAAKGLAGHWNSADTLTGPVQLRGLDGAPTGVALFAGNSGEALSADDPATTGQEEQLMDDFLAGTRDQVRVFEFQGLERGLYRVITYAWTPQIPDDLTTVWIEEQSEYFQMSGGAWPGGLVQGITHTVHHTNVVAGQILLNVVAGDFLSSGNVNGIQLMRLGDVCIADWNHDAVADSQDFFDFLDDFFAGFADFNADGATDSSDFFGFLQAFFMGC